MNTTLSDVFNTWDLDSYYEEDRTLDFWEKGASFPSDEILVHEESHKWIVSHIPKGANIVVHGELIVLGDVFAEAVVTSTSGGAEITVKGNIHEGAVVAACGGGAKVIVDGTVATSAGIGSLGGGAAIYFFGKVDKGVEIRSEGGGAQVFFLNSTRSHAYVNGGGAEVLNLGLENAQKVKDKLKMDKNPEPLSAPATSNSSHKAKSHSIFGFTLDVILRKRS